MPEHQRSGKPRSSGIITKPIDMKHFEREGEYVTWAGWDFLRSINYSARAKLVPTSIGAAVVITIPFFKAGREVLVKLTEKGKKQ